MTLRCLFGHKVGDWSEGPGLDIYYVWERRYPGQLPSKSYRTFSGYCARCGVPRSKRVKQ